MITVAVSLQPSLFSIQRMACWPNSVLVTPVSSVDELEKLIELGPCQAPVLLGREKRACRSDSSPQTEEGGLRISAEGMSLNAISKLSRLLHNSALVAVQKSVYVPDIPETSEFAAEGSEKLTSEAPDH